MSRRIWFDLRPQEQRAEPLPKPHNYLEEPSTRRARGASRTRAGMGYREARSFLPVVHLRPGHPVICSQCQGLQCPAGSGSQRVHFVDTALRAGAALAPPLRAPFPYLGSVGAKSDAGLPRRRLPGRRPRASADPRGTGRPAASEREPPVWALGPQRGGSEDSQRDPPGRARPPARRRPQSPALASQPRRVCRSRARWAQRAVLGEAPARIVPVRAAEWASTLSAGDASARRSCTRA
ncbi:hypothetical protein NDU88_006795 [Pleurodeles waltl]|uniref:Uncharacterized protein n=1 Tax=Pleurodeles waltl TaxID=8319 RepID=A0AAV7NR81_PLEWA|nr:hypothetical protein NDU88_006795 [Pleurodeles waltl]